MFNLAKDMYFCTLNPKIYFALPDFLASLVTWMFSAVGNEKTQNNSKPTAYD